MTLADEVNKLAELRAQGRLTEEEFARAKERVLNGDTTTPGAAAAASVNKFRLSTTDRWIGGVCGGLAQLTGAESWIFRLLFAALFLFAGAGLLLYVLLWIFVPRA